MRSHQSLMKAGKWRECFNVIFEGGVDKNNKAQLSLSFETTLKIERMKERGGLIYGSNNGALEKFFGSTAPVGLAESRLHYFKNHFLPSIILCCCSLMSPKVRPLVSSGSLMSQGLAATPRPAPAPSAMSDDLRITIKSTICCY